MGCKGPITSLHVASSLQGHWVCCDGEDTVPGAGDSPSAALLSQPERPELHLGSSTRALGWAVLPALPCPACLQGLPGP